MALRVDAPGYAGPLDVLFQLVSSHEVDILEVPLAPIVDAFVAHLRARREECSMDELSEFLLYAALLLELKSQRLLPGPDDVDADEETIGWEERDVLLARLLELRAYAAVADALARQLEAGRPRRPPGLGPRRGDRGPRAGPARRACTPPTSPRPTCAPSRTAPSPQSTSTTSPSRP